MNLDNLYPFGGNHAIQNVIFVVEWADPLGANAITAASKLANKFKNQGLLHKHDQQIFELRLEAGQIGAPDAATKGLAGVVFSISPNPADLSRSVTISRQHCLIAIPDYTRWVAVMADVELYLKIALDDIAIQRPVSAITLQYTDQFNWKDDPAELELDQIFAANEFVPRSILQQKGLWHAHQGRMKTRETPTLFGQLDALNVNMLDASGERVIQIIGSHKANLASPLWQPTQKNKQLLSSILSSLHESNKKMMRRLLTAELKKKIRLDGEKNV